MNFKSLIILAVVICQAYAVLHGAVLGVGVKALAGAAILKFAKFALSKNDDSGFNSGFGGNRNGHEFGNGFGNGHHGYYGGQSYGQGPREYKNEFHSSKTYAVDGGSRNSIHHGPYGYGGYGHNGGYGYGSYGHGGYGYPVGYGSSQFSGNVLGEYAGGKSKTV